MSRMSRCTPPASVVPRSRPSSRPAPRRTASRRRARGSRARLRLRPSGPPDPAGRRTSNRSGPASRWPARSRPAPRHPAPCLLCDRHAGPVRSGGPRNRVPSMPDVAAARRGRAPEPAARPRASTTRNDIFRCSGQLLLRLERVGGDGSIRLLLHEPRQRRGERLRRQAVVVLRAGPASSAESRSAQVPVTGRATCRRMAFGRALSMAVTSSVAHPRHLPAEAARPRPRRAGRAGSRR